MTTGSWALPQWRPGPLPESDTRPGNPASSTSSPKPLSSDRGIMMLLSAALFCRPFQDHVPSQAYDYKHGTQSAQSSGLHPYEQLEPQPGCCRENHIIIHRGLRFFEFDSEQSQLLADQGTSSPMPPANTSWSSSARHRRESAKYQSRPTPVRRLSQPVRQQDSADIQKQCRNQDSSVHVASPTPSAPVSSSFIEPTVWCSTWGSVSTGVDLPTTAPRPP